jgi:hypothetical protein
MKWLRHIAQWLGTKLLHISGEEPANSSSSSKVRDPVAAEPAAVVYVISQTQGQLRQGEILSDVIQRRKSFQSLTLENPEIEEIRNPYSIVVTQDCDLEQDYKARFPMMIVSDKLIPNVLLVQVVTVDELTGDLRKGRELLKRVVQNKDERYHVLEKVAGADDVAGTGLPSLGADFKRYFTVPTDELYAQLGSGARRRTQLNSPYLEHFSQRFATYVPGAVDRAVRQIRIVGVARCLSEMTVAPASELLPSHLPLALRLLQYLRLT